MLESLSTEKNSLVFQLERLEQQMNSASGSSSNGSSINMSGIDNGEGNQKRNLKRTFHSNMVLKNYRKTIFIWKKVHPTKDSIFWYETWAMHCLVLLLVNQIMD